MRRLPATGSGPAQPDSLERAQLVRSIAEALSSDAPLTELWVRCCSLLCTLMECERVTIAIHDQSGDRIAYAFNGSVGSEPIDRAIRPGTMASEILSLGETVVRDDPNGFATGVPIRFGRTLFGAICLERVRAYDAEQLTLLESCALYVGARLYHENTIASSERYAKLAFTDGLTGIGNRRMFDEALAREWLRALRDGAPMSLLMIDLDFFKSYNDTYGHQSGDLCLQRVAHCLHDCLGRPADLAARYGGEEFVALLPGTDLTGAAQIAEEIRAAVAQLDIGHEGSSLGRVSLSIGVAADRPSVNRAPDSLLASADEALYRAKLGGRNRVYAAGYETDAESARPRRTGTRHNLPVSLTRLIGRKTEIAAIVALLEKHRLVSIVGTGGTGKTRTAIAVASEVAGRFADGVWFVDLSPISDPMLVASTIAAVFNAEVSIDESGAEALAVILESKDALIVIDNCEHVLGEVANLSVALLRHCHKLNILTTSREPLGLSGEAVYRLPLLSMPSAAGIDAQTAGDYDAVALFIERVVAANSNFTFGDDNVDEVLEICRAVDGIALAIELAASRVGILGLSQVATRLREFRLLGGSDRTVLPRQRTMHAMIGWSYDLLSDPERTLFCRLSIFAGSFTFDAVTEICAGTTIEEEDVFETLTGLIRKSMVVDDPGHENRYRLLDSVRAFAQEKLLDAGETDRLSRRHADYFEAIARQADAMFRRAPSREWMEALEPDVDNFRAAMEWALDRRGDVVLGSALAAATINFFNDYMPSEATRWMRKALDVLPKGSAPRIEGRLCLGLATSSRNLPAPTLRAAGERAIEIARQTQDMESLTEALRGTASIIGWYFRDDREFADKLAMESIEIARVLGDPIQLAISLRTRGLTIDISDFPAKRAVLEESLDLMRRYGNDRQIGTMLTWISDLEFSAGDRQRALEYGREAVRFAESSGSNELYGTTTTNLANYACAMGDWETAQRAATEAIRLSRKTRQHEAVTFGTQALAALAAERGNYERAAQLLGFCDSRCGVVHPGRQADQSEEILYRSIVGKIVGNLGEDRWRQIAAVGATMNEEEAIALAFA